MSDMKAWAVWYRERFGFSVIPIGENKKPTICWAELQDRRPEIGEIVNWPIHNLGLVTGEISSVVVVDCDSEQDARTFAKNVSRSPTMVKSKRGYHFYFQHPGKRIPNGQKITHKGCSYDVRGDGGYSMLPPSSHSEGLYLWEKELLNPLGLPVFQEEWRWPEGVYETPPPEKRIKDAEKYIRSIRAVSGSGGHDDTYRAAAILQASGLSEGEALLTLQEWNKTNAEPPWSDRELLHKIRSVYACAGQDDG